LQALWSCCGPSCSDGKKRGRSRRRRGRRRRRRGRGRRGGEAREEREEEVLEKRSWERIYSKVRSLLAFLVQKYVY
jgi:hypothetical protein